MKVYVCIKVNLCVIFCFRFILCRNEKETFFLMQSNFQLNSCECEACIFNWKLRSIKQNGNFATYKVFVKRELWKNWIRMKTIHLSSWFLFFNGNSFRFYRNEKKSFKFRIESLMLFLDVHECELNPMIEEKKISKKLKRNRS